MKKIFAMMLALAMMFSMVACGGTTTEPTEAVAQVEGTVSYKVKGDCDDDNAQQGQTKRFFVGRIHRTFPYKLC